MSSITRDDQVWIQDGNAIIVSEDSVAFRVHLGTIAHRSDVFRDLFALPCSGDAEHMDGCPVIRLQDSSTDLRHLLLVLCCGKNYYYARDEALCVPFSVLGTLIRLGHKYAIHDVLEDALSRLKKYYPITLPEWDDVQGRSRWVETSPIDAITVIGLAKLTDTPSLLPTAYLTCCGLITSREHTDALRALPSGDLHRILNASASTSRSCALRLMDVLHPSRAEDCRSPEVCEAMSRTLSGDLATLEASVSHLKEAHLVPDAFRVFWEGLARTLKCTMCDSCMLNTERVHFFSRAAVWMWLPKDMFQMEVEGWSSF